MSVELIVLRIVHVVGGVLWVGAAVFNTFFLVPSIEKAGPSGGAVMTEMMKRKVFIFMPIIALLTMLAGARLMMIVSAGNSHWFEHRSGHTYAISAALAIIAFLLGLAFIGPTMGKIARLQKSATDDAARQASAGEIAKLRSRAGAASTTATILLLLSAIGMAIARYM